MSHEIDSLLATLRLVEYERDLCADLIEDLERDEDILRAADEFYRNLLPLKDFLKAIAVRVRTRGT